MDMKASVQYDINRFCFDVINPIRNIKNIEAVGRNHDGRCWECIVGGLFHCDDSSRIVCGETKSYGYLLVCHSNVRRGKPELRVDLRKAAKDTA